MSKLDDGTSETLEAGPTAAGDVRLRPPVELHELGAGDTIGRYKIVGVLGAGGMGRVYRALDPDLNRELAIKVLRRAPGSGGSGGLEHRLLREAQAMARLKHGNLATVYDVGSVRGEVFIAFEFIDGQTLAAWMRTPGRTTAEKLAALVAAGRGLEAAHSAGVIHRDFKPDNVLVANDGDVKVVDFGLARGVDGPGDVAIAVSAAGRDALASDLTMTGSLLGTPAYMAPEQHKGLASDARADQFGFAVSAWEALFGERPFKGKNLETIAAAILGGVVDPPAAEHDVPPHIEKALRRALSVDPAARFTSIGELLAILSPAPASRNRRWLLAASAAVVLVGAGIALVATSGGSARERVVLPSELPPAAPPPPLPPAPPEIDEPRGAEEAGDLDKAHIRDTIRRSIGKVQSCFESAMVADDSIAGGEVLIEFEIGPEGRVVSTRIVSDEFQGKGGIAGCIGSKSFEWQFPRPVDGGSVKVSYPFQFRRVD